MDDIFIACVTDILSHLEAGNTINPGSVLHEQLRDIASRTLIIVDSDLEKNQCMKDLIEEEFYNLDNASDWFKSILLNCKK